MEHCTVVASTLEFQLPKWCAGHLEWTRNDLTKKAVADAYLKLIPDQKSDEDPVPPLPVEFEDTMNDFIALGVWEFKSLLSGDEEEMNAVLAHAKLDRFPWVGCSHGDLCILKCPNPSRAPDTALSNTALSINPGVGPDAELRLFRSTHSEDSPSVPDMPEIDPRKMLRAQWMLQQVYTELVIIDGTFASLHSGLYEIMTERERVTNTLYITDVLKTNVPGYAKRVVGLYIAMLRDARRRSTQLKMSRISTSPNLPSVISQVEKHGFQSDTPTIKKIVDCHRAPHTPHRRTKPQIEKVVKKQVAKRTLALIEMRYGIYNSPAPAAFVRSTAQRREKTYTHKEYFSLVPENLTLIEAATIDLDRAELGSSECARRREMRHLTSLLNGHYSPQNEFPSAKTTPEKKTPERHKPGQRTPGTSLYPVVEIEFKNGEDETEIDEDSESLNHNEKDGNPNGSKGAA
ncbi:hypothetical protein H0H81_009966 [Sphagnurus paluster]|uniref:Uncharacterized protein n=1 Tax=Sphagnurus paluster TaxID=117069 RepID=A0A9P7GM78_9AGAR|nr:hypothetical protein H0H81_009966 [Sphagnurus paluster]